MINTPRLHTFTTIRFRVYFKDPWTTVDETDCTGKYDNGASTAATKTVAITQNVVSGGSTTETTCTLSSAAVRNLVIGDTVTISGYTGSAEDLALNQEYVVAAINRNNIATNQS